MNIMVSLLVIYMLCSLISTYISSDVIAQGIQTNSSILTKDGSNVMVGSFPTGVAINSVSNKIYVANQLSNTISVIDSNSDQVQDTIKVGKFPYGLDLNHFNDRIYVANRDSDTISVIDGSTHQILENIPVGKSPLSVAVNPSDNLIYVSNINSGTLSVIDGINNNVAYNIHIGKSPYDLTINPLTHKLYVSDISNNTISVIDTNQNKVVKVIPVGTTPAGILINIETNLLYVTNYASDTITVINGTNYEKIKDIFAEHDPVAVAINPLTNKIYVSNIEDNTVSVIDGNSNELIKSISVLPSVKGIYDSNNPILRLPLNVSFPLIASKISVDTDSNKVYITNTASNTISIIDGKNDSMLIRLFFSVIPDNSGNIQCNDKKFSSYGSVLYSKNSIITCKAIPNKGFSFSHWSNLLTDNKNSIELNITNFGTLAANFEPALSSEQYLGLIAIIVGIASFLVIILFRRRERRYLDRYMTRIDSTYDTLATENKQDCIDQLESIRKENIFSAIYNIFFYPSRLDYIINN